MRSRPQVLAGPAPHLNRSRSTWALYSIIGLFAYLETSIWPTMPFIRDNLDPGFTAASLHFSALAAGAVLTWMTGERFVRRWGENLVTVGWRHGQYGDRRRSVGDKTRLCRHALRCFCHWFDWHNRADGQSVGAFGPTWRAKNYRVGRIECRRQLRGDHGSAGNRDAGQGRIGLADRAVVRDSRLFRAFAGILQNPDSDCTDRNRIIVGRRAIARALLDLLGCALHGRFGRVLRRILGSRFHRFGCRAQLVDRSHCDDHLRRRYGGRAVCRFTTGTHPYRSLASDAGIRTRIDRVPDLLVVTISGFELDWTLCCQLRDCQLYPLSIAAAADAAAQTPDQATARLAIAGGLALLTMPLIVGAVSDIVGLRWGC